MIVSPMLHASSCKRTARPSDSRSVWLAVWSLAS